MLFDDPYVYQKLITVPPMGIIDTLLYELSKKELNLDILLQKMFTTKKAPNTSDLDIIVIGGCPRSGTTLARALIGMHPRIAAPQSECHFLASLKNPNYLKNIFDFSSKEIDNIKEEFDEETIRFIEYVLRLYMKKEGKQLVALKAPVYITLSDELFNRFPNMRLIHCLRDGRDVACSLRTFPKKRIVNWKAVPVKTRNSFGWCVRAWVAHVNSGRKSMKSDKYMEVKYEDLVYAPIITMKKIFDFLNLEMPDEDQLLSYYKFEKDEKHPQNIEIGRAIYEKSIARWKTDMSNGEKEKFKKMAGELLITLGYEKDLNW